MCRQGRYNLDPGVKFFATPPVHGSLARYVDHPADFCFKMPDSLSYEQGAMVEPLSNAGLFSLYVRHAIWQSIHHLTICCMLCRLCAVIMPCVTNNSALLLACKIKGPVNLSPIYPHDKKGLLTSLISSASCSSCEVQLLWQTRDELARKCTDGAFTCSA